MSHARLGSDRRALRNVWSVMKCELNHWQSENEKLMEWVMSG